jgi:hypothetical protein
MSNQLADYAAVTVGTTAVPLLATTDGNEGNFAPHASISVFADPANTGTIYIGSSKVSTTRYAAAITASQMWTIAGSAINGGKIYILGSAASQIAHPSAT